ncbi:MAG: bifunctional farnesyl-diphosphate farnesyltransferase/squalene synthase [Caeruleum heppii]|nr:MAG: bifunctional farnesyl-diphosphate farnesyltransferase/squalene synthase [Caeruleum heppii]
MPSITDIFYYAIHHQELRSIIQWKVWHDAVHQRDSEKETLRQRTCFDYLERTSRSFSAVIQELHPELLLPVALFYLILRGLDTIEDDMTIDQSRKVTLLKNFHEVLEEKGWSFDGNGPNEKDRDLLVNFSVVIEEFCQIKPAYRSIIKDITKKMGHGMAEFVMKAEKDVDAVATVEDYDLYCHYVAGLVGEGLTRLFVESGLANPALLERSHLQESMGLFLQKTNIIRDVREDWEDNRRFWPKEIWSKHVERFDDLFEPSHIDAALNCSSDMVLNALEHADECLFYLAGLKEQSVFNFAAIPQSMAIATLDLVFRNPAIFQKNVKITKGQACQLMVASSQNLQTLYDKFRNLVRQIHQKNTPKDPNYLQISIACGKEKIEQFIESIFPTQKPEAVALAQAGQPVDPDKAAEATEAKRDMLYMLAIVGTFLFAVTLLMFVVAYLVGARFDIAFAQLKQGKFSKPGPSEMSKLVEDYQHGEL